MSKQDLLTNPLYKVPKLRGSPSTRNLRYLAAAMSLAVLLFWICTEYVALRLGNQSALGLPLLSIGVFKLYAPFDWLSWYARWKDWPDPVVHGAFRAADLMMLAGAAGIGVFLAYRLKRDREQRETDSASVHGSAHWASTAEVKQTGLLGGSSGVYIGAWKDTHENQIHYLRHDGPEHIMAFAPTRSGKGVGLVLPTLLSWPHSAVIYDIKGENWALTSGWRQQQAGSHVVKFEPTSMDGSAARFNPLAEVRVGTEREVADIQNIMTMLVDPDGKGLKDHWQKSAQSLLVAVGLHVLYADRNKTLNGMMGFLSEPSRTVEQSMRFMLDTDHDLTGPGWPNPNGTPNYCHPVVSAAARDMLNKAQEEQSSVVSSAISYLTLYRDPIVRRNTAESDFKVRDLMNADKPVSLYLVVPPSDKDRLRPLVRLMINQIVRGLTEKMEFRDGRSVAGYKHRLLLMLDEFPSLGKLDVFEESLAFIAGYGLKAYLIIQDISQLWTAYGKDESIFSNCHVRVAYAPNKVETAELLSKMTGTATIVKQNDQYSGGSFGGRRNITSSTQETQRPLLTADEVMRLPAAKKDATGNVVEPGDMLIFMAGQTPIYGKQILYFMDPVFTGRAKVPAPAKSDVVRLPAPAGPLPGGVNSRQTGAAPGMMPAPVGGYAPGPNGMAPPMGYPPGPNGMAPPMGYPPWPNGMPPPPMGYPPWPNGMPPPPMGYPPGPNGMAPPPMGYPPGPNGMPPPPMGYPPGPNGMPPPPMGYPPGPNGMPPPPMGYPPGPNGMAPPMGYPPGPNGMPPPPMGYPPGPNGMPPPPMGYPPGPNRMAPPPMGYPPGPNGMPPPPMGYPPGPNRMAPPPMGYPPGPNGMAPPPMGYPPGPNGMAPPPMGYPPGPNGMAPPPMGYPPGPNGMGPYGIFGVAGEWPQRAQGALQPANVDYSEPDVDYSRFNFDDPLFDDNAVFDDSAPLEDEIPLFEDEEDEIPLLNDDEPPRDEIPLLDDDEPSKGEVPLLDEDSRARGRGPALEDLPKKERMPLPDDLPKKAAIPDSA